MAEVPPTPAPQNGLTPLPDVPFILLEQTGLQVGRLQGTDGLKAITIGPLFLTLPLDSEAARIVVKGLTGIELAGAGAQPPEPGA